MSFDSLATADGTAAADGVNRDAIMESDTETDSDACSDITVLDALMSDVADGADSVRKTPDVSAGVQGDTSDDLAEEVALQRCLMMFTQRTCTDHDKVGSLNDIEMYTSSVDLFDIHAVSRCHQSEGAAAMRSEVAAILSSHLGVKFKPALCKPYCPYERSGSDLARLPPETWILYCNWSFDFVRITIKNLRILGSKVRYINLEPGQAFLTRTNAFGHTLAVNYVGWYETTAVTDIRGSEDQMWELRYFIGGEKRAGNARTMFWPFFAQPGQLS